MMELGKREAMRFIHNKKTITFLVILFGLSISVMASTAGVSSSTSVAALSKKRAAQLLSAKCRKQPAKNYSICKSTGPPAHPGSDLLNLCKALKNNHKTNSASYKTGENCNKIISDAAHGGGSGGSGGGSTGSPAGPFNLSPSDLGLENSNPGSSLQSILNGVYVIAGGVAVLMIVISGLLMVVNGDNPQNVATARNSIIFTSVGLVVIVLAFVITNVVLAVV